MSKFSFDNLNSLTTKIGSGATPRGGKESYKTEGISLIRSMNVYDFIFDYNNLAKIDKNQASRLKNVIVEKDDILLNITGASVCRCAIVPDDILPLTIHRGMIIIESVIPVLFPWGSLMIQDKYKRCLYPSRFAEYKEYLYPSFVCHNRRYSNYQSN